MTIIKNIIIKNKLHKELAEIETQLQTQGYYQQKKQLATLAYKPDKYAELYKEIEAKFQPLLLEKQKLEEEIKQLSGAKLFKGHQNHSIK